MTNQAPSRSTPESHERSAKKLARIPIKVEQSDTVLRKPDWIRVKLSASDEITKIKDLLRDHKLHTVCEEAACPNLSECFQHGTATFMIMGDLCTRRCPFCDVAHGKPLPLDVNEPKNLADAIKAMALKYVVITSVDRDDLEDGGASTWASVIYSVKNKNPDITIEVLIPDFDNRVELIQLIADAQPDIISHNIETVERLTPYIRSRANYKTSLDVIRKIVVSRRVSKSGIMLGLGETIDEIYKTMDDLVAAGCEIFTMGQYLQPTKDHFEVAEYIQPDEFYRLKIEGLRRGFRIVESAPLVRSSYHAETHIC